MHANINNLEHDLTQANLTNLTNTHNDITTTWDSWQKAIFLAINSNVRRITIKHSDNPPWINKQLIQLIRKKNLALKNAKKVNTKQLWAKFKRIRNRLNNQITYKHRAYLFNLCNQLRENPKGFWTLLKSQTKSSSYPTKIFFNGIEAHTPLGIAQLLNSFFHSIFSPIPPSVSLPQIQLEPDPNLHSLELNESDVLKVLISLNPSKAPGPDKIPTLVLKNQANILSPSITQIFNKSLAQGKLPPSWKKANIIPIHKKGSKFQATNYRPISLLPIISKVLERCVYNKIIEYIIPKLADQQHGFLAGRSTTSQLMTVFTRINNILDNGDQADVIYFDLSKAFDSVPHKFLIHKLKSFGIHGSLLAWLTDYLTNRFQRVIINGFESDWLPVTSGVPQGSILGPLLFLLYINDLPTVLSPETLVAIFADDTKIYRKITNPNEALALQSDINALHNWSQTWGLKFNSTKCTVLTIKRRDHAYQHPYTMDNQPLARTNDMTDLGININSKLRWNNHIDNITSKATQQLWLIKRTLGYSAPTIAKTAAYTSLVRSILEYSTLIWNPTTKDNVILLESSPTQSHFLYY